MKRQRHTQGDVESPSDYFRSCQKLAYHGDDASIVTSGFLAPVACTAIINICEEHASSAEGGGWQSDALSEYAFTTVDLEVRSSLSIHAFFPPSPT